MLALLRLARHKISDRARKRAWPRLDELPTRKLRIGSGSGSLHRLVGVSRRAMYGLSASIAHKNKAGMIRSLRPISRSQVAKVHVSATGSIDRKMRHGRQIWQIMEIIYISEEHRKRRELHDAAERRFAAVACLKYGSEVSQDKYLRVWMQPIIEMGVRSERTGMIGEELTNLLID